MKSCFICIIAMAAMAHSAQVTPVQKVLELLSGMLEKGKKEKHDEQVAFAASKQYCGDNHVVKTRAIEEEDMEEIRLEALIEKDGATVQELLRMISTLHENEDIWSEDIKAATKVRKIEKADYQTTHADYGESIDALKRAIQVLKKQARDRKQAGSFTQITNVQALNLIPDSAKKALNTFLLQDDEVGEALDMGAPEANGYEFQSAGIVDMFEKLLDKFIDERTTLEKEEANAQNAYDMLLQELHAEITQAVHERTGDEEHKAETLSSKASETADLSDTEAMEVVDKKSLSELDAMCSMKESDYEARQQLRAEELETIEKVIEIISSGAVSGSADKHLPALVQKQTALAQLKGGSSLNTQLKSRVAEFLKARAKALDSRILEVAAERVEADPFAKVKKMVKDLIVKLMEEANEEAEHKGWCDTELSTNEQTRKEKTTAVEELHAGIDELTASIAKLTDQITDLSKSIADLDAAMAKATDLRQKEKAKNTETTTDASEAQTAVAQALTVLKEFYAKAGEATSFLQVKAPFKGNQEGNGGVVGMLEVIESDFARLESETKAAEATAQKEFDEFSEDSSVDKAAKSTDVEHKQAKKQDQSQALTIKKEDLEGTQKELDSALAYYDKLKPSCVDSGVSYEDRVARRKEEVESMQEALKILNGESI